MGNKKVVGTNSSAIQLSGNVLGFEEELEEDLKALENEVYEYLFNDKHGDMEQRTLFPESESDADVIEDELLEGEPEPEPKKSKSKKKK